MARWGWATMGGWVAGGVGALLGCGMQRVEDELRDKEVGDEWLGHSGWLAMRG
jgi:hypothetical protein